MTLFYPVLPGRGTQRLHIALVEDDPLVSQKVKVRRDDVRVVEADVIPAKVICHYEHYVGRSS